MAEEAMDFGGAIEQMKELLSGPEGSRKIQEMLEAFSVPPNGPPGQATGGIDPESAEMMMNIQKVMQLMRRENDNEQARLLQSLKPFLSHARQNKVDKALRLLNMGKIISLLQDGQGVL